MTENENKVECDAADKREPRQALEKVSGIMKTGF